MLWYTAPFIGVSFHVHIAMVSSTSNRKYTFHLRTLTCSDPYYTVVGHLALLWHWFVTYQLNCPLWSWVDNRSALYI